MNINLNDFKVSNDELKDLGLDNDIVVPSVKDDEDFYTGQSEFEGYLSLDTDTSFSPGFEESSSFDSEDYSFDILD